MMNDIELENWFRQNNIPVFTQKLIHEIRTSPPERKVQGGGGNVHGVYPSRKMGVTIQFESNHVEFPVVYKMEYDPSVLEFYDQPKPVHMKYESKKGKKVTTNSTPDFFVIRKGGAGWEECKKEEQLVKLAENQPNRYVRDENGQWICPPGVEYAAKFGLTYTLRSSKDINWTFQRNIVFLEDYLKNIHKYVIPSIKIQSAKDIVSTNFGINLEEFLNSNSIFSKEELYIMIAQGSLYTNLYKNFLLEPTKVHLFINREMANIHETIINEKIPNLFPTINMNKINQGSEILWDNKPHKVLNLGTNYVTLQNELGAVVNILVESFRGLLEKSIICMNDSTEDIGEKYQNDLLLTASEKDMEEANRRYVVLQEIKKGNTSSEYSSKTITRWKKAYDEAQKLHGNGFLGLLSRKKNRGNRSEKIEVGVKALIDQVISSHYLSIKQTNVISVYSILVNRCKEENLSCPSYVTFTKYIKKITNHQKIISRKGKRAAYQLQQWHLDMNTPKHGDRPFEVAHIDHTELDVELVLSDTNQKLTFRPYLTLMIDAYSRIILAHYITFDPPSFRSNMMVFRECVRNHNRLPQNIIVDGGKEFHGVHFDFFCAQFEIVKKVRPPGQARFGSVIERLFGTTNTMFIHNLRGNTQLTKEVRVVTKSINPKNNSLWTLSELDNLFYQWIEFYHNQIHSTLGITPKEQFERGMAAGGERLFNTVSYNENFIIATLPPTLRGSGKVHTGKGVVYNNIWYWNDEFRLCESQKVNLKYDPFDVGTLYAYVNNRWVKCISEYYYLLKGKSEKELAIIT